MKIQVETVIERPAAEVFRFQADGHYENHPRWDPRVIDLKPETAGPVRLGSRFALTREVMGRVETMEFEVVEFDSPRRFAIETRSPEMRLRLGATCDALSANRTRVTLTGEGQLNGPQRLLLPLMKRRMTKDVQANLVRIKKMVEAESSYVPTVTSPPS